MNPGIIDQLGKRSATIDLTSASHRHLSSYVLVAITENILR